jgi:hypothetical protein
LLVLHVLFDVLVALYRCVNLDAELTDLLAAAVPRSQLCLLAIWLALGREPFSWRVCGLLAGTSLMFTVFTRLLFPGRLGLDPADYYWFEAEWGHFFRHSGPGDLLAGVPALVLLVAIPLGLCRAARGLREHRTAGRPWRELLPGVRLQFRFGDLAIWVVAICVALVAAFQTAPYAGWFEQLRDSWPPALNDWQWWLVTSPALALPYAAAACAALWAVVSNRRPRTRLAVLAVTIAASAAAYHFVWRLLPLSEPTDCFPRSPSAPVAALLVSTLTTAGSLWLFQIYRPAEGRNGPPGHHSRPGPPAPPTN